MSSLRLSTQLQQKMVLTPQLRQRIEMLQMNALELNELIEQEMVANPVLEEVLPGEETQEIGDNILDQNSNGEDHGLENENRSGESGTGTEIEANVPDGADLNGSEGKTSSDADVDEETSVDSDAFDDIDYGREFQDYLDPGYRTQEIEYKDDAPTFEQFLTHSPTLSEHLEWQLNLLDLSSHIENAAIEIIGNLNVDGRLTTSIEEVAESCGESVELLEKARSIVMQLDPVGCGATDVQECLLAQLLAGGETDSLACQLVRDHLQDLQPHRLQHLAKATGLGLHELDDEIDRIRQLDPYPGRRYSSEEAVFVSPEVYIEKLDDDYVIFFADDGSPRLRISSTYHSMLDQEQTTKETKDFIKEKVRSAVDLLRHIEHRRQTIY
ncbi:MAG: RNA polymerase sigma-54 factor, partial [Pyrinomonadaceae bacterium]